MVHVSYLVTKDVIYKWMQHAMMKLLQKHPVNNLDVVNNQPAFEFNLTNLVTNIDRLLEDRNAGFSV